MSKKRDYYEVLGVSKNATDSEIKSAFRKLSLANHPDRQAGKSEQEKKDAEERFKEAAEAYECLSDKDKRTNYDRFGFDGPQMNGGFSGGFNMNDFMRRHGGMFGSFFGGGSPFGDDDFGFGFGGHSSHEKPQPNSPENGRDVRIRFDLDFKDALFGCTKEFDIKLSEECSECHGTGMKSGSELKECPYCHGSGMIQERVQHGFMMSISTAPCPHCHGSGWTFDKCPKCNGERRVAANKHVNVKIPSGIESGQKLKVKSSGECGVCGGQDGDLYLMVNVKSSDIFERNGLNLGITQPISPIVASLGGEVDVLTPYGYCKMKVPAGTKSGQSLRISGKGVKSSAGIGDLIVHVIIEPLTNLSKEQKELIEKLQKTITIDNLKETRVLKTKTDQFLK